MPYRQVRGFDLQQHAVDPATGGTLCGLPPRKVSEKVGGVFHPGRQKTCKACEQQAESRPDPKRRRRPSPGGSAG